MDVNRLYPSVPREEGIEACRQALDLRQDPIIPTKEVVEMIELVLDNNNFSVGNSKHYMQVNGTAIGSKLGRNYACTYLGKWETDLLNSCELKPFIYLRYIDDIFGIWVHGEDSLREFHQRANNIHQQIKLELRISTKSIEFLDVRVHLNGGKLDTDVYTKPTDSKAYLHFSSDHPEYMKKSIPLGLAMRAKRICSSNQGFTRQTQDICKNLCNRGYPRLLVNDRLKRVEGMDRGDLLDGSTKKRGKQGVPLVITFSSYLPNISKILKEKRHLLARSDRLKRIFDDGVFVSYRRGTNLKDILVHKKTKQLGQMGDSRKGDCGKNCVVCKVIYKQEEKISGPGGASKCTYDKTIGCRSRNVIYGIFCEVCNCVVYVGETGGVLYQRVQNHLSNIRCNKNDMEVAAHFNGESHQLSNARFVGLEKVWKGWVTYRRVREQRWIGLFETHRRAGGLNKKTS